MLNFLPSVMSKTCSFVLSYSLLQKIFKLSFHIIHSSSYFDHFMNLWSISGVGGCGHVSYLSLLIHQWKGFIFMEELALEKLCWWTSFLSNCKQMAKFYFGMINAILLIGLLLHIYDYHSMVELLSGLPVGGRKESIFTTSCWTFIATCKYESFLFF